MVDALAKEVEKEKMKVRLRRNCIVYICKHAWSLLGDSYIIEFIVTFFSLPLSLKFNLCVDCFQTSFRFWNTRYSSNLSIWNLNTCSGDRLVPTHDSDKNYSPVKGFVRVSCFVDHKVRQTRKDCWCRFLISLNIVRKLSLLLWVMLNKFKVSRKEPKCHKLQEDLTKPQWQSDRSQTIRNWKSRMFLAAVATSRSESITGKCFMKKSIICLSWRLICWLIARNFQIWQLKQIR